MTRSRRALTTASIALLVVLAASRGVASAAGALSDFVSEQGNQALSDGVVLLSSSKSPSDCRAAAKLDRRRARTLVLVAASELAHADRLSSLSKALDGLAKRVSGRALADLEADIARLKKDEAADREPARAQILLAAKLLTNASDLQRRASDLEHPV